MGEAFLQGGWVYALCLLCTRWSYSIRSVKVRLMRARPSFLFLKTLRPAIAQMRGWSFSAAVSTLEKPTLFYRGLIVVDKASLDNPPEIRQQYDADDCSYHKSLDKKRPAAGGYLQAIRKTPAPWTALFLSFTATL